MALIAGLSPVMGGMAQRAFAADRAFAPAPSDWKRYQISTAVALPAGQPAQLWLPVPSLASEWQRSIDTSWSGNTTQAELIVDPTSGARFVHARFDGSAAPQITLVSGFETRNRTIDWAQPAPAAEDPAVLAAALAPSANKPLQGLVTQTAQKITAGAGSDVEKVRAIYGWIVANCYRNLDTPGCGPGDTVATLTSAGLGGKCADLNGLFVALARASGVPARDLYGVRVAPSAFGYKQLGAGSADISKAQHCRAEVFLSDYGWVAMDPADVLKVMRAESETWIRDPADPLVAEVNRALLGNWEGNWVAYNSAEDVALPGAGGRLPFLMYPQGVLGGARLNELDPKAFGYTITAQAL